MEKTYDFTTELKNRTKEAEAVVRKYLPKEEGFQKTVISAMHYSVEAGGKRLRPILMLESYRAFGGTDAAADPFLAALEMIHTYSLVHDDLPAMDNDTLRRGKPTTWAVYGDGMGVLAGDALLNYAFETAISSHENGTCKPEALFRALSVLAQKAGIYGMIGGQVADVEKEGQSITGEEMAFIHENKTCALLEAALMIGAILAGAKESEIETMEKCGHALGMAFQIRDDILDVTGTTEELGKPVGSDEKNEKNTYVSVYGLEASQKMVEEYSEEAVRLFDSLGKQNVFLRDLMLYLMNRNK